MKTFILGDWLYKGLGGAALVAAAAFSALVFFCTESPLLRVGTLVFLLLILGIQFSLVLFLRRRILLFTEEINAVIDSIVNGEAPPAAQVETETLGGKLQYKLKRLHAVISSGRGRIEEEKQALQEMVSDISHQVKTPVANLKIYNSTLLQHRLPKEKQQEFLELMETQIDKLDFLMQSMVKMSRLETGVIALSPKPAALYDTIGLALTGIVLPAEQKGITVEVSCPQALAAPHDRKWTAEALFNLLDNAVKYTPAGGRITVTAEAWETVTKITVADTGRGIPEGHIAQIFKRFYREPEVHGTEGVGLGLFLSREIISKQGGYIQVKSQPGKGSTFSVFLPNA